MNQDKTQKTLLWISLLAFLSLPLLAGQVAGDTETNDNYLPKKDSILSKPDNIGNNSNILIKTTKAVLYVIILGASALYLTKKLGPKLTQTSNRRIRIIEQTSIGVRKSLHLVQIGDQTVLLGSTPDRIIKLCDIAQTNASNCEEGTGSKL